jgi:hypothetical protein
LLATALLLAACGTPSKGGSISSTQATPTPNLASMALLNCRLAVVTYGTFDPRAVTASGAGGQGADVGFFQFPNGPAVTDPNDLIGWDPTRFRTHTLQQPVLESGGQSWTASWDAAAGRWVPVEAGLVSPDGAAYAWTEDDFHFSRIHVTTVADGHDRVVLASGSGNSAGLNYAVVGYDQAALLLTSLAASEGAWYNSNRGLWRLDVNSRQLSQVAPSTMSWTLLSIHAAWSSDVDPAGGPPVAAPPPDTGAMPNRLIRLDLATGATQTWITRPGKIVTLLGVDLLDRPLLRIQSADSTEIDYSTAPGQTTMVYRSASAPTYGPSDDLNATGAGYAPGQVMVDSHGIWLTQHPGEPVKLFLFNPRTGLERVQSLGNLDSVHAWHPAGSCT